MLACRSKYYGSIFERQSYFFCIDHPSCVKFRIIYDADNLGHLRLRSLLNHITFLPLWNQNQFRDQRMKTQTKTVNDINTGYAVSPKSPLTRMCGGWFWVCPEGRSLVHHMFYLLSVKPLCTWWRSLAFRLCECVIYALPPPPHSFLINPESVKQLLLGRASPCKWLQALKSCGRILGDVEEVCVTSPWPDDLPSAPSFHRIHRNIPQCQRLRQEEC